MSKNQEQSDVAYLQEQSPAIVNLPTSPPDRGSISCEHFLYCSAGQCIVYMTSLCIQFELLLGRVQTLKPTAYSLVIKEVSVKPCMAKPCLLIELNKLPFAANLVIASV